MGSSKKSEKSRSFGRILPFLSHSPSPNKEYQELELPPLPTTSEEHPFHEVVQVTKSETRSETFSKGALGSSPEADGHIIECDTMGNNGNKPVGDRNQQSPELKAPKAIRSAASSFHDAMDVEEEEGEGEGTLASKADFAQASAMEGIIEENSGQSNQAREESTAPAEQSDFVARNSPFWKSPGPSPSKSPKEISPLQIESQEMPPSPQSSPPGSEPLVAPASPLWGANEKPKEEHEETAEKTPSSLAPNEKVSLPEILTSSPSSEPLLVSPSPLWNTPEESVQPKPGAEEILPVPSSKSEKEVIEAGGGMEREEKEASMEKENPSDLDKAKPTVEALQTPLPSFKKEQVDTMSEMTRELDPTEAREATPNSEKANSSENKSPFHVKTHSPLQQLLSPEPKKTPIAMEATSSEDISIEESPKSIPIEESPRDISIKETLHSFKTPSPQADRQKSPGSSEKSFTGENTPSIGVSTEKVAKHSSTSPSPVREVAGAQSPEVVSSPSIKQQKSPIREEAKSPEIIAIWGGRGREVVPSPGPVPASQEEASLEMIQKLHPETMETIAKEQQASTTPPIASEHQSPEMSQKSEEKSPQLPESQAPSSMEERPRIRWSELPVPSAPSSPEEIKSSSPVRIGPTIDYSGHADIDIESQQQVEERKGQSQRASSRFKIAIALMIVILLIALISLIVFIFH